MYKDFDTWNTYKKMIETKKRSFVFNEGEIWWSTIGVNIGDESCGKGSDFHRPILVLKKLSNTTYIGIPLSLRKKKGTWFTEIILKNKGKRWALLYQIRMFSTYRFQDYLDSVDRNNFNKIKEKLEVLLELSIYPSHNQNFSP